MTNWRASAPTKMRPSGAVRVAKKADHERAGDVDHQRADRKGLPDVLSREARREIARPPPSARPSMTQKYVTEWMASLFSPAAQDRVADQCMAPVRASATAGTINPKK
jgi:hypothetical protein